MGKEEKEKILHDVHVKFPEPPRHEPPEKILERLEEVRDESPLRYKPEVEMTPEELIEWEEILEEVKKVEEVLEEVKEKKEEVEKQKEKVEKAKNETIAVVKNITEHFPPPPGRYPELPPETPEEIKERVIAVREESPLRHKPEEEMLEPEKIEWEEIKENVVIVEELFEEYEEKHEEEKKEEEKLEEIEKEVDDLVEDVQKEFPEPPEPPEKIKERVIKERDESPLRHKPEAEMSPEEIIEWQEIKEKVEKIIELVEKHKEAEDKKDEKEKEIHTSFPKPPPPPETPKETKERVIAVRDESPLRHKPKG